MPALALRHAGNVDPLAYVHTDRMGTALPARVNPSLVPRRLTGVTRSHLISPCSVHPDHLAAHDCLIFSSRNRRQSWLVRDDEGAWVKARGRSRLRLDSGEALRDAAISGLGIAFLPDFLVAGDLAAGRLQQVLPELELGDVNIVTIYPTKRLLEPRVRRFIDLMVEELGA